MIRLVVIALAIFILPVQARYWNQTTIYYWINPDLLTIEPLIESDLREVMEVPMSITLIQTSKRTQADIRVTTNDVIDTAGTTNYYGGDIISTVYCYINLDRLSNFKGDDYSIAIRNTVRHEFLHALLAIHHKKIPFRYKPLMNKTLSSDKVYWTYDDRKQLMELYPIKKRPDKIVDFQVGQVNKTAYFICKERPKSFQLFISNVRLPIFYFPRTVCKLVIE